MSSSKRRRMSARRKFPRTTRHHVPARSVGETRFILKKSEEEHRAYHLLFGVLEEKECLAILRSLYIRCEAFELLFQEAETLEDCAKILIRDWWTEES